MVRLLVSGAFVVCAALAFAGDPAATQDPAKKQQHLQKHFAQCLLLGNHSEIALSKFALEHTKNEKLRAHIQKMIDDHTKFISELQKFAPGTEIHLTAGDADVSRADTTATTTTVSATTDDPNRPMPTMFSVEYDAARECIALTKAVLLKEKGAHFEQAFIGQQIGMHIHMLSKLTALEKNTTGEFQALIKKGRETTKMHKDHLEALMDELSNERKSVQGQEVKG